MKIVLVICSFQSHRYGVIPSSFQQDSDAAGKMGKHPKGGGFPTSHLMVNENEAKVMEEVTR